MYTRSHIHTTPPPHKLILLLTLTRITIHTHTRSKPLPTRATSSRVILPTHPHCDAPRQKKDSASPLQSISHPSAPSRVNDVKAPAPFYPAASARRSLVPAAARSDAPLLRSSSRPCVCGPRHHRCRFRDERACLPACLLSCDTDSSERPLKGSRRPLRRWPRCRIFARYCRSRDCASQRLVGPDDPLPE